MVQKLSDEDHRRRLDFCLQLQDVMSSGDQFLENVQFSAEAISHISVAVNCRNVRIWGSENPHAFVEHQRDSPKVNVFCAICSQKVYSPHFFAEETVTGMTYLDITFTVAPCISTIRPLPVTNKCTKITYYSNTVLIVHIKTS
jgi:hypothetical protein